MQKAHVVLVSVSYSFFLLLMHDLDTSFGDFSVRVLPGKSFRVLRWLPRFTLTTCLSPALFLSQKCSAGIFGNFLRLIADIFGHSSGTCSRYLTQTRFENSKYCEPSEIHRNYCPETRYCKLLGSLLPTSPDVPYGLTQKVDVGALADRLQLPTRNLLRWFPRYFRGSTRSLEQMHP